MNKLEERFEQCVTLFEKAACKQNYDMVGGVKAVVGHLDKEAKDIAIKFARAYYYEMNNLGGIGVYPDLNDEMVFNKFIEGKYGDSKA